MKSAVTSLLLLLLLAVWVSCDGVSPSPTDSSPLPGEPAVSPGPPTPSGDSGVAAPPSAGDGVGTFHADYSQRSSETEWCATFTNDSQSAEWGTVACYEDENREIASQTLFDSDQRRLNPGDELTLCARKPCDNWQCDAVNLQGLPPKENPEFGSNLLLGRIGRNSDASCKPPTTTTTPPVCEPEGEGDGYNCKWNAKSCEWDCQTCEEAFPATAGNISESVTSSWINYSFDVQHAGAWTLKLYAGTHDNPTRYLKRSDSERLTCGEDGGLKVSYYHRYHGSCLWTIVAEGPGISVDKVVIDRCNVN